MNNTITKTMLVADLKKVTNKLRSKPTRSQYRVYGSFASDTVERHFGSWSAALKRVRA